MASSSALTEVGALMWQSLLLLLRTCFIFVLLPMQLITNRNIRKARQQRLQKHKDLGLIAPADTDSDNTAPQNEALADHELKARLTHLLTSTPQDSTPQLVASAASATNAAPTHFKALHSAVASTKKAISCKLPSLPAKEKLPDYMVSMRNRLRAMMDSVTPAKSPLMDRFIIGSSQFFHVILLNFLYYPCVVVAQTLHLYSFLNALTEVFNRVLSWVLNVTHINGSPLTLINVTSPNFDLPYKIISDVNFTSISSRKHDKEAFDDQVPHLLCMCSKLAYEHEELVNKVAKSWAFDPFVDSSSTDTATSTSPNSTTTYAKLIRTDRGSTHPINGLIVPDTYCFLVKKDNTMIVIFRGTSPTNLVEIATDSEIKQVPLRTLPDGFDKTTLVHEGFYASLYFTQATEGLILDSVKVKGAMDKLFDYANFLMPGLAANSAEDVAMQTMLEDEVRAFVKEHGEEARVFVTGHSLGAALASVFVATLSEDLAPHVQRNGGVVTFGQPRTGNLAYARAYDTKYGDCTIRCVNATDIVAKIPWAVPADNYKHHVNKWLVTTVGGVVESSSSSNYSSKTEAKEIDDALVRDQYFEDNYWMFTLVYKLRYMPERWSRKVFRVLMLPAGATWISDHFPDGYEYGLRQRLTPTTHSFSSSSSTAAAAVGADVEIAHVSPPSTPLPVSSVCTPLPTVPETSRLTSDSLPSLSPLHSPSRSPDVVSFGARSPESTDSSPTSSASSSSSCIRAESAATASISDDVSNSAASSPAKSCAKKKPKGAKTVLAVDPTSSGRDHRESKDNDESAASSGAAMSSSSISPSTSVSSSSSKGSGNSNSSAGAAVDESAPVVNGIETKAKKGGRRRNKRNNKKKNKTSSAVSTDA